MIETTSAVEESGHACRAEATPWVFVVDDNVSLCESLEAIFKEVGWETQTFGCAAEFLAYPKVSAPSCVVLDIALPDANGLDIQDQFVRSGVNTPIIFITGHADIRMTVKAMKAGAVDVLTKPLHDDALLSAIERALEVSSAELRRETEMATLRSRYTSLTRRETDVMVLVVAGRLNKQIAAELSISEITVKAHRGKMMRKMMARSVADLVRIATRLGVAV